MHYEKKRILVIEDQAEVRENVMEILALSGYEVDGAENGKRGIEKIVGDQPDLILCDIMMPQLDGFGVLRILRSNPKTANIPLIFLTAKTEKEDLRKGMGLGAEDYITKPFHEVDLLDAIEVRLQRSAQLRFAYNEAAGTLQHLTDSAIFGPYLDKFTDRIETRTVPKQTHVYREGQHPQWLYLLDQGAVKCQRSHDSGKEVLTGIYGAGSCFGYRNLLNNTPYTETVLTLEESTVRLIHRQDFLTLLYDQKDVARHFLHLLSDRIERSETALMHMAYSSVRKRIARAILAFVPQTGNKDQSTAIRLRREDLAAYAGTATETAIRTLSDFKEEQLIDIRDHEIIVLNADKLHQLRQ